MADDPENRWLRFGLATNPYFVEPLGATDDGPRPISLFRGRKQPTKDLLDTVSSEQNGLIIVEAPAGVGKSTFVNHAKFKARKHFFAPANEVGVQSGSNAHSLLLQVLDALVRHASDIAPQTNWQKDLPTIHKARQLVMALQSNGWDFNLGLTGPTGVGGNVGAGKSSTIAPPLLGPVLSPRFLDDLVRELLVLKEPPSDGVILHINNLDVLMRESVEETAKLFSDLREHFQVVNTHWIFLGPPGLQAEAIAPNRRVLPFVKATIELAQLPVEDVQSLLEARYSHYKIRGDWVRPSKPDLVATLYHRFGGDLRGTLDALGKAHRAYRPVDVAPMDEAYAIEFLGTFYRRYLEKNLRPKSYEILEYLVKKARDEFTQDDAEPVEEYQGNRSTRFSELEAVDAVRFTGNEGRRKVYAFGGAARLAFDR